MSGRAPETNEASPTNTRPLTTAAAGSPGLASRKMLTFVTARLSSDQPVTAIDPLTVLLSAGVSNEPKGGADGTDQPSSWKMPSVIGPGLWTTSPLNSERVISELTSPAT